MRRWVVGWGVGELGMVMRKARVPRLRGSILLASAAEPPLGSDLDDDRAFFMSAVDVAVGLDDVIHCIDVLDHRL